ncbi:MAG TPA: response regulator transcription factor [Lacunisphaera sp.]|nr:response regulator transcription factor [Lacunisphaera sp.]
MGKLRILVADDHAILRQGMRRLIEAEPDLQVVAEAQDGSEVPALVAAHQPDIVVLDLSMPQVGGVETLRQLRAAQATCKVLVLTVHEDRSYLREVLEAGALGYMLKRAAAAELIDAIRSIARGQAFVDARITTELVNLLTVPPPRHSADAPELTVRELDTLRYIAEGYSNKEIGAVMELSVKTVETYKARAMRKLGLLSRVDIVRIARERRWPAVTLRRPSGKT